MASTRYERFEEPKPKHQNHWCQRCFSYTVHWKYQSSCELSPYCLGLKGQKPLKLLNRSSNEQSRYFCKWCHRENTPDINFPFGWRPSAPVPRADHLNFGPIREPFQSSMRQLHGIFDHNPLTLSNSNSGDGVSSPSSQSLHRDEVVIFSNGLTRFCELPMSDLSLRLGNSSLQVAELPPAVSSVPPFEDSHVILSSNINFTNTLRVANTSQQAAVMGPGSIIPPRGADDRVNFSPAQALYDSMMQFISEGPVRSVTRQGVGVIPFSASTTGFGGFPNFDSPHGNGLILRSTARLRLPDLDDSQIVGIRDDADIFSSEQAVDDFSRELPPSNLVGYPFSRDPNINLPEDDLGFSNNIPLGVFPNFDSPHGNGLRLGTTTLQAPELPPRSAIPSRVARLYDNFRRQATAVRAAMSPNRMVSIELTEEEQIHDIERGERVRFLHVDESPNPLFKLGEIFLGITGGSAVSLLPAIVNPASSSTSPAFYTVVGLNGVGFLCILIGIYIRKKKPVASGILTKLGIMAAAGANIVGLGMFLPPNIQWTAGVAALIPAIALAFI